MAQPSNGWLVFDPEDESTVLGNVDELIPDYTASLLLVSPLCEPRGRSVLGSVCYGSCSGGVQHS